MLCSASNKLCTYFYSFCLHEHSCFPTGERARATLLLTSRPWLARIPGFHPGSVQFSRSVVSDSLRPHESQHSRPPWPSPTPGVYSNPCPSGWWCHPTTSSSVSRVQFLGRELRSLCRIAHCCLSEISRELVELSGSKKEHCEMPFLTP